MSTDEQDMTDIETRTSVLMEVSNAMVRATPGCPSSTPPSASSVSRWSR